MLKNLRKRKCNVSNYVEERKKLMKTWLIEYSIKYKTGRVKEGQVTMEAEDITIALGMALGNIRDPMMKDPEIEDVVIWDVGIVEDDVF